MNGKQFEELIKLSCEEQGVDITRLKDAGYVGDKSESRRFTPRNICDFILNTDHCVYYIEAKRRQTSLAFKDITQFDDLKKKEESLRAKGLINSHVGLLCYFENFNSIWWVNIEVVDRLKKGTKKSFSHKDLVNAKTPLAFQLDFYLPIGKRKERIYLRPLCSSIK